MYNGELEGITIGLEKAVELVDNYLDVKIYADNQAALLRLKTASNNPGQEWQIRCIKAAKRLKERGLSPSLHWVPGHQDIQGNEKADTLAKEATKLNPPQTSKTSLAIISSRIRQLGEREWLSLLAEYRIRAISKNPNTYAAKYKWKIRKQLAIPGNTSRAISSTFY